MIMNQKFDFYCHGVDKKPNIRYDAGMIKILKPLPREIIVATSGGIDSMALLDFLSRRHSVTVAFFNHGTETSALAQIFLENYCTEKHIQIVTQRIQNEKPTHKSQEEYWRDERYAFLHSFDETVVTAHHLGDCVEQWIFSSLHGNPNVIPYANKNVVRPLLTTTKNQLREWCVRKMVPWIEDSSNTDTKYMRNYIRHELMPHALRVNPGLEKVVKKKVIASVFV